jgi:hypothetical protein
MIDEPPLTMSSHRTPSELLVELSRQHADLCERISRCEQLADRFDADLLDPALLLHEVAALRSAFEHHDRFEERALRWLLLDTDGFGGVRIRHMVEDHVAEHRALQRDLDAGAARELRSVLASLRKHLETEERYLIPNMLSESLVGSATNALRLRGRGA